MDLFCGEQFSSWFLSLNPRGEVPVLKHGNEVVVESSVILEYVDKNFGRPYLLFPHENGEFLSLSS